MDERTRLFLYVLAGVGFFAVLGGLFGAVAGALTWRDGRPAGTALGLTVARAFARFSENGLSANKWGDLVGGTDGVVFGAVIGTLVGLIAGWHGSSEWQAMRPLLLGALLLAAGAVLFGLLAVGVALGGGRAVVGLFIGGMGGAASGFALGGIDGLLAGAVAGAFAGTVVGLLGR